MKTFLTLCFGFCLGLVAALLLFVAGLLYLGPFLVVDNEPVKADIVVALGGGDGSRLRKGIELYDDNLAREIVLVDKRKRHWDHIVNNLCKECNLEDKKVTYLIGSENTSSDAELSLEYCKQQGLKSVLVVTDPYHSRRAQVVFKQTFAGTGIETIVVHSGYYGKYLSPDQGWWKDRNTLQTVWVEFGKIVYVMVKGI
jgi:uncharacterized SAM-binding protein YcdF (DUF218 family)